MYPLQLPTAIFFHIFVTYAVWPALMSFSWWNCRFFDWEIAALFKNTNVEDVLNRKKQQREQAKEDAQKKKEQDKMQREKDKLAKQERKDKEKKRTQKGERKR